MSPSTTHLGRTQHVMQCYLDARLPAADSGDVQWRWRSTASEVVSAGLRWSSTLFVSTTQLNVLLALSRNVTCSVSWLDTDGFRHWRTKIAYHPTEKVQGKAKHSIITDV